MKNPTPPTAEGPRLLDSTRVRSVETAIKTLTLALLILLGISLFAHKIIDTDIWWHLRTGRYIVESRSVPGFDTYSYTAGGSKWIDLHWLFQLILYGTHAVAGGYGLSLLFIFLFCLTFVILWRACPREKYFPGAVLFFWAALMACTPRFLARPEAFTFLMIAIYVFILSRYERGECYRLVYLLIPLQVLWTNLQGLFIIGPFLIGAYLAGIGTVSLIPWQKQRLSAENAPPARPLLVTFIGAVLVCLVNPYGIEGLLFPITLFTRVGGVQNIFARSIAEFQPPFSGYNLTGSIKWFGAFLTLSAVAMVLNYRNLRVSNLVMFLGLAYLALNARRNIPIFALAVLPVAVTHVSEIVERFRAAKNLRFSAAIRYGGLACCVVMSTLFLFHITRVTSNKLYISDKRAERFGFGFKEQTHPRGAFVFIRENGIRGPFFNNLDIGGMFIYEMYPNEKAFIDARLEVNSADVFAEYRDAMSDAYAFAKLSRKYVFNAIVISHTAQDTLDLMPALYYSPEWALVYLDPLAAVFVRAIPENKGLIDEERVDISVDLIKSFAPHDTVNNNSPRLLKRFLAVETQDMEAQNRFNLGLVLLVMGQFTRAIEQFNAGLELMPFSPEAYYNLGLAYERMGRMEAAVQHYEKAIELNPRHARAHTNLGAIYDARGLKDEAEREYKLAVQCERNNTVALYNLGMLYYESNRFDEARTCWERALRTDPSLMPAQKALEQLEQNAL